MPAVAASTPPQRARVGDPVWVIPLARVGTIVEIDVPSVVVRFHRGMSRGKFLAKTCFLLDRAPIGEPQWIDWLRTVFQA
jgi:hypothetical protein